MQEMTFNKGIRAVLPLGDVWAIDFDYCKHVIQMLENSDMVAHTDRYNAVKAIVIQTEAQEPATEGRSSSIGSSEGSKPYAFEQGVAMIDVEGVLTKKPTSMEGGTSSVQGKALTRKARRDADAHTLMFRFDSCPGGNVEGISEWADEIYQARQEGKRTVAVIQDACNSAGYFLASQCDEIYMTSPTASSGSIGTYGGITDISGMAEEKKVKVHRIAPEGYDFKGAGMPGTKVTDEHLAYLKDRVTKINSTFVDTVFRGRGITEDKIKAWGGRSFIGKEAVEKGIVDGIHSIEDVFHAVQRAQMTGSKKTELASGVTAEESSNVNPPAKTGNKGKRTMDNKVLVTALAASGLNALSTAVATAGDSDESVAQAIARELSKPGDPRLSMLDDAGVKTSADLEQLRADAKYGQEKQAEMLEEGKKLCLAVYGQEKGSEKASMLERLPREFLTDTVESLRDREAAKVGRGPDGTGQRQTAGARLDTFSENVREQGAQNDDDLVNAALAARGKTNGRG